MQAGPVQYPDGPHFVPVLQIYLQKNRKHTGVYFVQMNRISTNFPLKKFVCSRRLCYLCTPIASAE